MSEVRLSNGSPTLERTDPRVPDHPKPSACRNLFGSVDHEELKRDLKGHLREIEAVASEKWSFDFANNIPLPNARISWELVDSRTVPDFYTRQRGREKICSAGNNHVDLNGNHSCDRSDGQMECAGMRKRCHEHSSQNKRSHSSSPEESCPAEHTPRKKSPKRQT